MRACMFQGRQQPAARSLASSLTCCVCLHSWGSIVACQSIQATTGAAREERWGTHGRRRGDGTDRNERRRGRGRGTRDEIWIARAICVLLLRTEKAPFVCACMPHAGEGKGLGRKLSDASGAVSRVRSGLHAHAQSVFRRQSASATQQWPPNAGSNR